MDTKGILSKEFSAQDFAEEQPYAEMLDRYKDMACNYASMENAIAVLSDLRTNASYIYYGKFSRMLEIGKYGNEAKVPSIWEEEIFRLFHPDDLASKHLQELCFFHFVTYNRMKTNSNGYMSVLHRMFYIYAAPFDALWLALCLYSPLSFDIPAQCMIINSANGQIMELDKHKSSKILSVREKQVLNLIDKGFSSKEIAATLCISINTVSRHRQEILAKLQVKNSIEACRIAKDLRLI